MVEGTVKAIVGARGTDHRSGGTDEVRIEIAIVPFTVDKKVILLDESSVLLRSTVVFIIDSRESLILGGFVKDFHEYSTVQDQIIFSSLCRTV